jgi:hypothetical protein
LLINRLTIRQEINRLTRVLNINKS